MTVLGDQARLHQVVANLLANARGARPGAPIEVRVHQDGTHAVIEVRDEGPGMADADAARAFERFYRADASRSRHHGGSGLGLVDRRRDRARPRRHRHHHQRARRTAPPCGLRLPSRPPSTPPPLSP